MHHIKKYYTIAGWIAILYMIIFFLYPLLVVTKSSFMQNEEWSLFNYIQIFSNSLYMNVLVKTIVISFISTLCTVVIGYILAYFIANRKPEKQGIWLMVIISPMFVSLTIRLYGWMIFLSEQGPLNSILSVFTDKTISLLFTPTAVTIGIVHFVLPFMVLNIYNSIKTLDKSLEEASIILGASKTRTFWKVTFPLTLPGVYAGSSIAFALASSTFLVPIMLGGPSESLLSNMAYDSIVTIGNTGMGAALSILLLVIVVIVLGIVNMLERRGTHV
ncbi:MAG TPA: ABC transporter permease [Pseudogracilibacillus sp.]|nr:ABC transporter permease [Pseudogracilibacillus sp.]